MRKRWVLLLCIIIPILFSSCSNNEGYFYNHPEMKSDIEKEAEDIVAVKNNIIMKTKFMEEIKGLGDTIKIEDIGLSDEFEEKQAKIMATLYYEMRFKRAEEYLNLDEDGKIKDYLIAITAKNIIHRELSGTIESMEDEVDYQIQILQNTKTQFYLDNDLSVNLALMIEEVAQTLEINYEECLVNVYRPFVILESIEEYHRTYYLKNIYDGEKIKYVGDNEEEFEQFFFDVYNSYNEYMNKLVDEIKAY